MILPIPNDISDQISSGQRIALGMKRIVPGRARSQTRRVFSLWLLVPRHPVLTAYLKATSQRREIEWPRYPVELDKMQFCQTHRRPEVALRCAVQCLEGEIIPVHSRIARSIHNLSNPESCYPLKKPTLQIMRCMLASRNVLDS
jgi:hypothetical protein